MARTQRPEAAARAISKRLLTTLQEQLGMTMTEASVALGYSNPSTLHAVKSGRVLPDAARLARFATKQLAGTGRTVNLHWLLTGHGDQFIQPLGISSSGRPRLDVDVINSTMRLDDAGKKALLLLLNKRS